MSRIDQVRKWAIPLVTAIVGLGLGAIGTSQAKGVSFDQLVPAVKDLGFPIVIALALLLLLTYVIFDAVAHFNTRLDTMGDERRQTAHELRTEQSAAFRDLANAIGHLDHTLDRLADQAAANHEAINSVLLFISHTQSEVVAHRTAVEGTSIVAPEPLVQSKPAEEADNGTRTS